MIALFIQQHQERIAAGTASGVVRAADAASASGAWSVSPSGIEGGVAALAHAPDTSQLLVLGRSGGAAVLDSSTGAAITQFKVSRMSPD